MTSTPSRPRGRLVRWLSEPLVLFLILGSGVFALQRLVTGGLDPDTRRIAITPKEIEWIRGLWHAQTRRAPTEAELAALIEDYVREEILVREALRLGLDRDDVIVRRRLAQKMRFLIDDTADVGQPKEAAQRRFFEEHLEDYASPARYSFVHVYLSPEVRGDSLDQDGLELLLSLRDETTGPSGNAADADGWRRRGDPFMLRREYAERSEQELTELFGGGFAGSLGELPIAEWSGPVRSAYGLHLVRLISKTEPRTPPFEEVQARVIEDLRTRLLSEANAEAYERISRRYKVEIEDPASAAAAGSPAVPPAGE